MQIWVAENVIHIFFARRYLLTLGIICSSWSICVSNYLYKWCPVTNEPERIPPFFSFSLVRFYFVPFLFLSANIFCVLNLVYLDCFLRFTFTFIQRNFTIQSDQNHIQCELTSVLPFSLTWIIFFRPIVNLYVERGRREREGENEKERER